MKVNNKLEKEVDEMKMQNKVFCEFCLDYEDYEVVKKELRFEDKRNEIEYNGKIALCKKCQNEIYVDEIEEENKTIVLEKIREKNDIISKEKIQEMLKKYNIAKRQLPLLLGWGEITITRYLDGYIPTKEYSDLLKKYYDSPADYYSLLVNNKDRISAKAYEKSLNAVNTILNLNQDADNNLIFDVSKYIIKNTQEVTPLFLQKLLYFVQVFSYVFLGKASFNDRCNAWEHGPVFSKVYYTYKEYGRNCLYCDEDVEIPSDLKVLVDGVLKHFGMYSGKTLELFTHKEGPWIKAFADENKVIEKTDIEKYALEIKEQFEIQALNDLKNYCDHLFNLSFIN